jgi:hypothetical protein
MDTIPFNALFINGLSYLVDVGSFQPRSTSHAVVAANRTAVWTQYQGLVQLSVLPSVAGAIRGLLLPD